MHCADSRCRDIIRKSQILKYYIQREGFGLKVYLQTQTSLKLSQTLICVEHASLFALYSGQIRAPKFFMFSSRSLLRSQVTGQWNRSLHSAGEMRLQCPTVRKRHNFTCSAAVPTRSDSLLYYFCYYSFIYLLSFTLHAREQWFCLVWASLWRGYKKCCFPAHISLLNQQKKYKKWSFT